MILTVTLNSAVDYTVFGDTFASNCTNRGKEIAPEPGGKGNNAARIANILGCGVMATGLIGGFTGDFIETELQKEGIQANFSRIKKPTRITTAFIEERKEEETKIVPDGPTISPRQVAVFTQFFENLLENHRFTIIAFCGSLSQGISPEYYAELIEIANFHKIPAVLDSSGWPLKEGIKSNPFVIKPNIEEAAELCGSNDRKEIFDQMSGLATTIPIVALTLGKDGAVFFTKENTVCVSCREKSKINPVGAGDAFVGGLAAAFDRFGMNKERLYAWAVAAGAATAGSTGLIWHKSMFEKLLRRLSFSEMASQQMCNSK